MRRVARWVGLCLLASCALAGCSDSRTPAPQVEGLSQRLSLSLGNGKPAVTSATGPMSLDLASAATTVPKGLLKEWLRTHGFQGGYSRVWKRDTDIVTALAYRFFREKNAADFVTFSADVAESGRYDTPAADPLVPGARLFTIVSRVEGATRFCGTEYFYVERDAFVITRCANYPVPAEEVSQLAQRQLIHAVTESAS